MSISSLKDQRTMSLTPDFDIPTTSDYTVSVGGRPVAVYAMPTRYGQTFENGKPALVYDGAPLQRPMYFACADIGGPTTVTVEIGFLPVADIRSVTAHPLSRSLEVRRDGARVTFAVDRPGTVTLLVNGDHRDRPLHLFFSPPVEAPPEGAIVFGPGFHDLGYDKPITLTDGQTLYLAPGAWVEGVVHAKNARHIRIMGRGVLSQRRPGAVDYAGAVTAQCGLVLDTCQDVSLSGIVVTRGIGGWCSLVTNCDRVEVRDYHVLASVIWSADGFNPCNCRDVIVERSFIRSGDDCIAIKGNTGGDVLIQPHIPPETQPPVENIHVRQSVFWCDHNEVFVIGCETRARHIRNVSIRDCDVLFHWSSMDMGVFGIIPLHGTEIRGIVYDDIRVEHCEEHLFFFRYCESIWAIPGDLNFPGTVADITIRNVSVRHATTGLRSEISGYAPDKRFENITIENLRYGGQPVTDAAGMGLRINEHVADVRFAPTGSAWTVTKRARALSAAPSTPAGDAWSYECACMFQISPTEIGVVPPIRGNSSRLQTVDLLMGSDLLILDQVNPVEPKAVIPLIRTERGADPRNGKPMLMMKAIGCVGFVPVGALMPDGTPHPHAGTGFGLAEVQGVPLDEDGKAVTYGWWLVEEPYISLELQQYRYDGRRFQIEKTVTVPNDGLLDGWVFLAIPLFNSCADGDELIGGFAAIPVGDTPLHPKELTDRWIYSRGLTSGIGRFRRRGGEWRMADFQVIPGADNLVEPTLVRGPDGCLYFSGRGRAASNLNTVSLWRSAADGANWERVLHVPELRAGTPVSINRALDGSLYIAGNPNRSVNSYGRPHDSNLMRETLRIWPLASDRSSLLDPITVRDGRIDFGPPPHGSIWWADHPVGRNVRLADGQWHHLLAYRVVEENENLQGAPLTACTGTYIEELFTPGPATAPEWRFAEDGLRR